ncbi:MAG TPA: four helix bundle protein [Bacteroidia bacterium]|jgi:four helix bundle protein|nr:four helix bundle protein [Bacteroidia bacterium]
MQHNVKELRIWNNAIDLVVDVYKLSSAFPPDERFGLTSQIRKAAVSIPSNIAEGAGRNTNKDFSHFVGISNGSSYEVMTQIIVANKLRLVTEEEVAPVLKKLDELQKMTYRFQERLTRNAA